MAYVLLSVSGHDRPGIVRDLTEALLHVHANIEDSTMTALRGRFTMMVIVRLPEANGLTGLKAAMAELERRTGLTVQSQQIPDAEAEVIPVEPDLILTVSGGDKPGIVHAVTAALADEGASVVDMSTLARDSEQGELYMMALEVSYSGDVEHLRQVMSKVAEDVSVDIEIHELDGQTL